MDLLKRILHLLFWFAIPGAFLLWVFYRAIRTLSLFHFFGYKMNQNNIHVFTFYTSAETDFQEAYASGSWIAGKPSKKWQDWLQGFRRIWALPYLLVSPGFWKGIFGVKSSNVLT